MGDYSGISFEYAAYKGRKVISVDVGEKIGNNNWKNISLPDIETSLRSHIGCVVDKDVESICSAVTSEVKDPFLKTDKVKNLFLFDNDNLTCGQRASRRLASLIG